MKRRLAVLVIAIMCCLAASCRDGDGPTATPAPSTPPSTPDALGQVRLTYYGHSMFRIESPQGTTILTDPNQGIGYRAPSGEIDVVTVSHEHFDHNKVEIASNARVLRGLDGDNWADIDETIGDVRIQTVSTYHDGAEGADRGKNTMFIFTVGNLRIVHAGDLGHTGVSFETISDLEAGFRPEVLLLPVGGHFTIRADEADRVLAELRPQLTIPMHYRTEFVNFPDADQLTTVDDFTAGKVDVQRPRQSAVVLEPVNLPTGILVLEPQPE